MKSYIHFRNRLFLLLILTVLGLIPAIAVGNPKSSVQAEFHVSLTCTAEIPYKSLVRMTGTATPFTTYEAFTDSSGYAVIQNVTTGQYTIQIHRFNYSTYSVQVNVQNNLVLNVLLIQLIKPPSNPEVNALSLRATWQAPLVDTVVLSEDWSSGNFTTNQWTISGGTNWIIGNYWGHSPPAATFLWSPPVTNYHQYLTSRLLPATYAAKMHLYYETALNNFTWGEYLDVEISSGSEWQMLKEYTSNNGSWFFTPDVVDISAWTGHPFQIRFHAHGQNSFNINDWDIDNIRIEAKGTVASPSPCVLYYLVFLNSSQIGTTTDTTFVISPDLVQYGQTNQVCIKAVFPFGQSQAICTNFTSRYLYPPRNLTAIAVENSAYLTWQKPQLSNGLTPSGLVGYWICRDGLNIKTFNSPDSLSCRDFYLDQGTYYYTVNAIYDLTSYGQPGQTGYSLQAGPVILTLTYCCVLPFLEDWSAGAFGFNGWAFSPEQGNWVINTSIGNPAPSASFTGYPARINYDYSLISHMLPGMSYTCAPVFLEFDYKLQQVQPTSTDFLAVEINRGGAFWDVMDRIENIQNTGWVHKKVILNGADGNTFKIRFRAYGPNSSVITAWYVDNIYVYAICKSPLLTGNTIPGNVVLTWTPPDCEGPGITYWWYYDDGRSETGYGGETLQDRWFGNKFSIWATSAMKIHEISAYFRHRPDHGSDLATIEIYNQAHILIASTAPFIPPENGWFGFSKEFWLSPQNEFYVMVHYAVPVHLANPVGYDTNGTVGTDEWAWVYDGLNWSKLTTAYGAPVGCFLIRAKVTIESDSPQENMPGSQTGSFLSTSGSVLKGYNIYRSDLTGNPPYVKLTPALCTDTTYTDHLPPEIQGIYCYYVTSVFYNEVTNLLLCESSSDTVCFDLPLGLKNIPDAFVRIYPNPVNDILTIESDKLINRIELFDCFGRVVIEKTGISSNRMQISFSALPQGIYLLKMEYAGGTSIRKVIKQ